MAYYDRANETERERERDREIEREGERERDKLKSSEDIFAIFYLPNIVP